MKRVLAVSGGLLLFALVAGLPMIRAMGAGQEVTPDNLGDMIANAKTAADHEAIANYYDRQAEEARASAKFHKEISEKYARFRIKPPDMVAHCQEIAEGYERIATQFEDLAALHRGMAKAAK